MNLESTNYRKEPIYTPPERGGRAKAAALILAILAVIVVLFAAPSSAEVITKPTASGSLGSQNSETISEAKKPNLELIESVASKDSFTTTIAGTIKNNTNRKYDYVQVSFSLYDASGAQIGTAFANLNSLEPGGTWRFEAMGFTNKTTKYKLAEITGW